jgi:hypothetical protein
MRYLWSLKPPHCQHWKSGMLQQNPMSSQNIPSCGDKAFGQQGTRSWSSYSQSIIKHLFHCNLKPTVWLLKLRLQMRIYLPRRCPNQQEFIYLLRWIYCQKFLGQWPQLWQLRQGELCIIYYPGNSTILGGNIATSVAISKLAMTL